MQAQQHGSGLQAGCWSAAVLAASAAENDLCAAARFAALLSAIMKDAYSSVHGNALSY